MAKKEKTAPPEMGGNIAGLFESIAKARDRIVDIDKEIKGLQADKKAIRENMETKGITKEAFDRALAYFRQDPEQRKGFDKSYHMAREGMGLPVKHDQLDMFKKPSAQAPAAEKQQDDTDEEEGEFAVDRVATGR